MEFVISHEKSDFRISLKSMIKVANFVKTEILLQK